MSPDPRKAELIEWLGGIDAVKGCEPKPASLDASFRRYFRLQKGSKSFIVMDAPPPQEDCTPFVRIAGYLEAMQLEAPRILEADIEKGFLLLSDLGRTQYLDALTSNPDKADALYFDAMDALHVIQGRGEVYQNTLPPYDRKLLNFELSLFRDWLCGTHLQLEFSESDEANWQACCELLVENAISQPQVFVHRDYHSRNLMVMKKTNPGILDFQDAVEGPMTYDLVSLLKDCYVRWPAEQVRSWALYFYQQLNENMRKRVDEQQFFCYFELMGVQRHLKAAGIFCRLNHRDGKKGYINEVPRTLAYILELAPRYKQLEFLAQLIEERVLPAWGRVK